MQLLTLDINGLRMSLDLIPVEPVSFAEVFPLASHVKNKKKKTEQKRALVSEAWVKTLDVNKWLIALKTWCGSATLLLVIIQFSSVRILS